MSIDKYLIGERLLGLTLFGYWLVTPHSELFIFFAGMTAAICLIFTPSRFFHLLNTFVLALALFNSLWLVPNHHFALLFMSLALTLNSKDQAATSLSKVVGAIFIWATVQKLLQPEFLNGSYIAWMLCTGDLGTLNPYIWPLTPEVVGNQIQMAESTLSERILSVPTRVRILAKPLSLCIVTLEAIIACAWLVPKTRKHLEPICLAFVLLLPLVRPEFIFTATLCSGMCLATGRRTFQRFYCAFGGLVVVGYLVYTLAQNLL